MRIYVDTEFVEDGKTIDLLSIGMVREDGATRYLINRDLATMNRAVQHDWLRDNVVKHLPVRLSEREDENRPIHWSWDPAHPDYPAVQLRGHIRDLVYDFIRATESPQLWAWYSAYDHVAYAQLFGRMVDLPDGFPMNTCDVKQEALRLGDPQIPAFREAESVHNALADAIWTKQAHDWLMEVERQHFRNTMAAPYSWDR